MSEANVTIRVCVGQKYNNKRTDTHTLTIGGLLSSP